MDGLTWFLLGMLFGVFIVVACAVAVFCRSVEGMDDQGEPLNRNPHAPPFRTPPPPPSTRTEMPESWQRERKDG